MPIQYALFENRLTAEPNNYAAQVRITDSVDLETIVHRITAQGSNISEATIRAVLTEIIGACEALLLEGKRVNLGGLCELFVRISGNFQGVTDHFDPARHRVDVGASPGSRVRRMVRDKAHVVKVASVKPAPAPLEYADLGSGERNGALTPGGIGALNGNRLKFEPSRADEGIFLIASKSDGKKPKEVRVALVQKNKPSQLVFLSPMDLRKGDYYLEVRARMRDSAEVRAGRLDAVLTV